MFEGQPKGLFALALANTGERFGYYTMLAVFALFLRANYGLSPAMAGTIYSSFLMLVYFLPLFGGILADKFGFGKMVTTGIIIMFAGYLLLSVPLGGDTFALVVMLASLNFLMPSKSPTLILTLDPTSAVPALPGAMKTCVPSPWASFQAKACSRPPEPKTKILRCTAVTCWP